MAKSKAQIEKRRLRRLEQRALARAEKSSPSTMIPAISGSGTYKTSRQMVKKIQGRGGYLTDLLKNLGGKALKGAVGAVGNAIVPGIGDVASDFFSSITGMGAYKVKRNSIMDGLMASVETSGNVARPPAFGTTGVGSDLRFTHSEYVADVQSSTAFAGNTYLINPGNPLLFPWLSQIAALYEMYEFHGLVIQYRPTSATAVGTTNAAMGTVLIATEYDAYDNGFDSKRSMDACEYASSGLPYERFLHPIECDPKRGVTKNSFVLPGVTSLTGVQGDARLDFLGATTIATVGQQAGGQSIGEIWVSYDVQLTRPVLENNLLTTGFTQHTIDTIATNNATYPTRVSNKVSGGVAFNVSYSGITAGSPPSVVIDNFSNGVEGDYLVTIGEVAGGSPAWIGPTATTFSFTGGTVNAQVLQVPYGYAGLTSFYSANYGTVWGVIKFTSMPGSVIIPLVCAANVPTTAEVVIVPFSQFVTRQIEAERKAQEDPLMIRLAKLEAMLGKSCATGPLSIVTDCNEDYVALTKNDPPPVTPFNAVVCKSNDSSCSVCSSCSSCSCIPHLSKPIRY